MSIDNPRAIAMQNGEKDQDRCRGNEPGDEPLFKLIERA
jgi:hypothetical protein